MIRFFNAYTRQKNFIAINRGSFICGTCLFLLICFCSCSQTEDIFNAPVRGYFERYTQTAAIVKHELCTDFYPGPAAGTDYIASTDDAHIKLYLRNPQRYQFEIQENMNLSFVSPNLQAVNSVPIVQQDENDKSVLYLTYPAAFLARCESQDEHDVSVVIDLNHEVSNAPIDSYTLSLRCDTKPPQISSAVAYADYKTKRYAILFAMPPKNDLLNIHKDISSLSIGEKHFNVLIEPDGTASFEPSGITPYNPANFPPEFSPIEEGKAFAPPAYWQPFYYIIADPPSNPSDALYDIALTDKAGFSSKTEVSLLLSQLDKCVVKNSDGKEITENSPCEIVAEAGKTYATLTVIPPDKTAGSSPASVSDVSVTCVWKPSSGTEKNPVENDAGGNIEIMLPAGEWILECTAHKDGYADSISKFTITVKAESDLVVGIIEFKNLSFEVKPGDGGFTVSATASDGTVVSAESWSLRISNDGKDISDTIEESGGSIIGNTIKFPSAWKDNQSYKSLKYKIAVTAVYNGFAYGGTLEYSGEKLGL